MGAYRIDSDTVVLHKLGLHNLQKLQLPQPGEVCLFAFCLPVCLFASLFVCLFVCLFARLFVCLFVCLFVRLVRFVLLLLLFNFVMHCIISTVVVAFEIKLSLLSLSYGETVA